MGYLQNYIRRNTHNTEIDGEPCRIEEFSIRAVGIFNPEILLREYFENKYGDNYLSYEINVKNNPGPEIYPEYKYFPETNKNTACSWIIKGKLYLSIQEENRTN